MKKIVKESTTNSNNDSVSDSTKVTIQIFAGFLVLILGLILYEQLTRRPEWSATYPEMENFANQLVVISSLILISLGIIIYLLIKINKNLENLTQQTL